MHKPTLQATTVRDTNTGRKTGARCSSAACRQYLPIASMQQDRSAPLQEHEQQRHVPGLTC
jgi:hypothetical protein